MKTTPYWMDTARVPEFPALDRDLEVDVAVIGGGMTGITTAHLLRQEGATVALLERGRFVVGESGHTTAHLTYVTDLRLQELVKNFGRDHAQAVWDAGSAAIQRIHDIADTEGLDCEFAWAPGYLHAPADGGPPDDVPSLQEDARLARELGFDADFSESIPLMRCAGIRFANQAKFHPRKYLAGLLRTLSAEGCRIFEETDASDVHDDPLSIKANGHTVRCRHLVLATHVPLQAARGFLSSALFQTKLAPYTTYAVGAQVPPGKRESEFWDTGDPYFYLRIDRHDDDSDYAILGGADHKTGQATNPIDHFAQVDRRLLELFPTAMVDHHWSGQVIETPDGLPYIGEAGDHQFVGTGYAGNGMTFGTLAGMMISDAIAGRGNPWKDLFDPSRKKLIGGAWDYLKENKDYPYYFLKDRLTKPGENTLEGIRRGEGKVVLLDGAKVAAYRDVQGNITVKSAICPHMGCVVRWNGAEKSWDCPCHGSRFKATGTVLAGPAESDLAEVPEVGAVTKAG